jgi:hypothetical protein
MATVWRRFSAAEHCAENILRLRSANCNADYIKMARILRGVGSTFVVVGEGNAE